MVAIRVYPKESMYDVDQVDGILDSAGIEFEFTDDDDYLIYEEDLDHVQDILDICGFGSYVL